MTGRRIPYRWISVAAGAAFVLSLLLDHWAYHAMLMGKEAAEALASYQLVREVGTLRFWAAVALAVGALRPGSWRRRVRAAAGVFLAAAIAGLAAEVLKVVIGRDRPLYHDGAWVLRPLGDRFRGGMGFPSSHAATAFGGAVGVWLFTGERPRVHLALGICVGALSIGCAASRMLTGAHFLSDVVGGAILGWIAARVARGGIGPRCARRWPGVLLWRPRRRRAAHRDGGHRIERPTSPAAATESSGTDTLGR